MYDFRPVLLLLSLPLAAGTEPRPKADAYPVHAATRDVSIGAEYLVHSVPARNLTFTARDHLVVEVALYAPNGKTLNIALEQFSLRINGRREMIQPQSPGFVAAGFKYPNWEPHPTLEAGAGMGDGGVILGAPQARPRFPGDPTVRQPPLPPRAPSAEEAAGVEKESAARPEEVVVEAALSEGAIHSAASGYLYFPFKEKTKSIHSLDLLYRGPAGTVTLRLF
ncbi:MAG TPA: hypothetical protein VEU62_05485 [Bryobacterales bacterium]|nr:hypothetical protein [Bryobacterales bacterium]